MSNTSDPAQKNLSEEDSSGSEAATETDRFGFILTNGSTVGSVGPPPELVRQREAKWINIIGQWDRILMKKSSKVKIQCQKGIPASLRAKCWPLLCGATNRTKHNKDLYQSLDSQPALQSWVDVIERDLDRQFPFHEMFLSRDGHGQRGLFRVLKAYTQYQPEEGYCQAQGPVAAVLLMNMPAEEAFWCLVQISEQYLPGYYSPLLEGVLFDAAMLTWVLKRTCPAAHKHLQRHSVEPLMFATDWLMCLFTRHLPFNTLLRVWDLFFCYGVRVLYQVAVVLVRLVLGRSEQRQECQGQMETLEKLRGVKDHVQQEDDAFIAEVCSVPLSGKDLEKQTEKELEKWRKDRPSSTFDPRGRCHGYQMVWARALAREEQQDKREREKGNLSVPLVRSASTLSLSPSFLRKRFRKGGKANKGEWEGGGRVARNLSMGANDEGWESWADENFQRVQRVEEEEDRVWEEHKEPSHTKLTGQIEQIEPEELSEKHNEPTQHLEEKEHQVQQQTEQAEPTKAEVEESQYQATVPSQQTDNSEDEDRTAKAEPSQGPVTAQCAENDFQHTEDTFHGKQGEEMDCNNPSQILEQQSHNRNNQENADTDSVEEETVKQLADSEHVITTEETETEIKRDANTDTNTETETETETETQTDTEIQAVVGISEEPVTQPDIEQEGTEIEIVHQRNPDTVIEIRPESELQISTETSLSPQVDTDVEELPVVNPDPVVETKTQQEHDEIEESDKDSQVDAFQVRDQSTDLSAETEMKAQSLTQTEPEENVAADTQEVELTQAEPEPDLQLVIGTSLPAETQEKEEFGTGTLEEPETDTQPEEKQDTDLSKDGLSVEETEDETVSSAKCISQEEQTDLAVHTAMKSTPNLTECTETNSEIQVANSASESDEVLGESEEECAIVAPEPSQPREEIVVAMNTEAEADVDTNICNQTQDEALPTETETHLEKTDFVTTPENTQASTQPAKLDSTAEPDGETASVQNFAQVSSEEPKSQLPIAPVDEEETEHVEEKAKEDEVFTSPPDQSVIPDVPRPVQEDERHTTDLATDETDLGDPELTQATAGYRISTSSGDFRVRKSSSSHGFTRRLSKDLFTAPLQATQSQSIPDSQTQDLQTNPGAIDSIKTPPDTTQSGASNQKLTQSKNLAASAKGSVALQSEETQEQRPPPGAPKRFGLFRRLRGEQTKQSKEKGAPKMQVPKILIQDFSDGVGKGSPIEEEGEEKLSSRERRRRRRELERREKEEEKLRKKREKEMKKEKEKEKEKERERKKPQTRGKSFQVQRDKGSYDVVHPANSGSQTLRYSASYAESYF